MSLDILIEIDEGGISERSIGSIAGGGGCEFGNFARMIVPPGGTGPTARRHLSSSAFACSSLWC